MNDKKLTEHKDGLLKEQNSLAGPFFSLSFLPLPLPLREEN
jgi:hypothetical protein